MPDKSPFVHLHTHSHYSLLEALPKTKALIKAMKERKMDTFALTDNGVMYGIIDFYQKCKDEEIKLIIGMDAYLAPNGRLQKRGKMDAKPNRLVFLCENMAGYKNLIQLSTRGFLEGFYYKPRLDKELIKEICQGKDHGLIVLSGGRFSDIDQAIVNDNRETAKKLIEEYVQIFGQNNFFLELVDRPEIPEQEMTNTVLAELGKEMGVPIVATKNVFYLKPQDNEAWKILQCVKDGRTLEEFDRTQTYDYDASLVEAEYMINRFKDLPEAIENTRKIADRCDVQFDLGKWNFAHFEVPDGLTHLEYLRQRAFNELPNKVDEVTEEMKKRIEYELSVIEMKGFAPYFLIVSDYIEWARAHGIMTATRGSAAGSLVSFSIGISTVNPIKYKLPFERFLNPERPSAPDVDGDFADNRRDEMIAYVTNKYGADKVAQICTFGTMLARGSIRDVGRALGHEYSFVDSVSKMVPMGSQGFPMTLKRALDEDVDLKKRYDTEPDVRRLINLAQQIEGCARHVSIHAAGVVFSPTPLTDFTPLQIDTREGKTITQYEMHAVEAAGLLKMDFLGIRNLSILGDAVRIIRKVKGVDINIDKIPVDDPKTFELLANGNTMGTFQLNGDGMTKYLMELKPTRIEDIMVMVALYRPGPIESIPEYIRRKYDASLIKYLDPRLEEILDASYGVIVYQDDVMLISIKLGGYSWLEADKLRKAMGKKIPEEMAKQKEKLLDGFQKHGLSKSKSDELWKLIEPFAAYGFNKAHAASYGTVAYQTSYLKANYPAEYMSALMTAESADLETISAAVKECQRMGIAVLPPDLNESRPTFTYIDDNTIRFGLVVIKNLGAEAVDAIFNEREANGPFKDLADFATRVHHRAFNKKALEALIKAGALDSFGERKCLLENIEQILHFNKEAKEKQAQNQSSLFDLSPALATEKLKFRPTPPAEKNELLAWEKELLGLYISAHPFDDIEKKVGQYLLPLNQLQSQPENSFVKVGGLVTSVKTIVTKKGDNMAFVGLDDKNGKAEVIVFPSAYNQFGKMLAEDKLVLVSAKVSRREGEEAKLLANSFIFVDTAHAGDVAAMLQDNLWVPGEVTASKDNPSLLPPAPLKPLLPRNFLEITFLGKPNPEIVAQLRELLTASRGSRRVRFIVSAGPAQRVMDTDYYVDPTNELLSEIKALVGSNNVKL
ncbi:MAG: DNA polymerase III subunit alpha [Patescibacteria group bacterium]|jgi:DNA polymerase-3 subunit alpha